jgi:quercetin dioxygenase-like cupin family protein
VPQLSAANQGTILLRVAAGNHRSKPDGQNNFAAGKPPVEDLDFARLAWNEVPARRANDPGARVAELSANPSRTRVSSLMECRPGWLLSSHEHLSDVFAFCARGGGILGVAQQALTYEAGHLAVIPAGVQHCFETGKEGAFLAVFVFEPSLERSLGEEAAATINHNTQSRIEEGSHEYDPCPDCR